MDRDMMDIVYDITLNRIGPLCAELLESNGMAIIFDDCAQEELFQICLLHAHQPLLRPVRVADLVSIDEQEYRVTAVGDVANKTLEELGHVTLMFDGAHEPQRPGCIHLGTTHPRFAVGSRIRIRGAEPPESGLKNLV
jgi:PTS system glucitol/sorbitol-specific IIA component